MFKTTDLELFDIADIELIDYIGATAALNDDRRQRLKNLGRKITDLIEQEQQETSAVEVVKISKADLELLKKMALHYLVCSIDKILS